MPESPWYRHNNAHQHYDYVENNRALGMVGKSIDDSSTGEDMETDKKDVVGQKHEATEFVCESTFAKDVISKVAYRAEQLLVSCHNDMNRV